MDSNHLTGLSNELLDSPMTRNSLKKIRFVKGLRQDDPITKQFVRNVELATRGRKWQKKRKVV